MISNTTAIYDVLLKLAKNVDYMFAKRAFVHWYIKEGMEEVQFLKPEKNQQFQKRVMKKLMKKEKKLLDEVQCNGSYYNCIVTVIMQLNNSN